MASIDYRVPDRGTLKLVITGRLDAETTGHLWAQVIKKIAEVKPQMLGVDASGIEYCDGAGIALLLEIKHTQERNNRQVQIKGLRSEFEQLITLFDPGKISEPGRKRASFMRFAEGVGQATVRLLQDFKSAMPCSNRRT